jgi:hypothetical protein
VTASDDGTGTIEASLAMSELGAMEGHGEGMMEEGEGMMEEEMEQGMEEGMEQGMEEGMEHAGFYIQAHLPDGTPAACADIEAPESSMM